MLILIKIILEKKMRALFIISLLIFISEIKTEDHECENATPIDVADCLGKNQLDILIIPVAV